VGQERLGSIFGFRTDYTLARIGSVNAFCTKRFLLLRSCVIPNAIYSPGLTKTRPVQAHVACQKCHTSAVCNADAVLGTLHISQQPAVMCNVADREPRRWHLGRRSEATAQKHQCRNDRGPEPHYVCDKSISERSSNHLSGTRCKQLTSAHTIFEDSQLFDIFHARKYPHRSGNPPAPRLPKHRRPF
jgi:hypothetical protein